MRLEDQKSNSTSNRISHINLLNEFVESSSLEMNDICIVGSSVMAGIGLRENKDLDIAVLPNLRHNVSERNLDGKMNLAKERYHPVGVSDRELISNSRYHTMSNGYKIARPELCLSYKYYRDWEKDNRDIELFNEYLKSGGELDWEIFHYDYYPDDPSASLAERVSRTLEEGGFKAVIIESVSFSGNFIRDKISNISDSRSIYGSGADNGGEELEALPCFIIWPSVIEYSEDISDRISQKMEIENVDQIDGEDELNEIIEYLYSGSHVSRWMIELKKHRLKKHGEEIAIIECKADRNSCFEDVINIKREIREVFYPELGEGSYHMIIHGPENDAELHEMEQICEKYAIGSKQ